MARTATRKTTRKTTSARGKSTAARKTVKARSASSSKKTTAKSRSTATRSRSTARSSARSTARSSARKTTRASSSASASTNFKFKTFTTKVTKTAALREIAARTGLTQKQVNDVFTCTRGMVQACVESPRACNEFTIPELGIKVRGVKKKATKARQGFNPQTGETIKIAAKPARRAVKLTALSTLKEFFQG